MGLVLPLRFVNVDAARARFGDRVDRLGAFLVRGDELADAAVHALAPLPRAEQERAIDAAIAGHAERAPNVPEALLRMFEALDRVPFWVDFARCDRGGAAFLASGRAGGVVLGLGSLIAGYCSPAGNKPLALSGRLREYAPRRLAETARFVQAVSLPGGMRRQSAGFAIAVRVRLMHARIRQSLLASPAWREDDWGTPICQADMAGTILLFSYTLIGGLTKLGLAPEASLQEDMLHLWRYVGHVMGVEQDLLCTTMHEADTFWQTLAVTQERPDDDARALASAMIATTTGPAKTEAERARLLAIGYALSRHFLGDDYADDLGYPKTRLQPFVPAFAAAMDLATRGLRGTAVGRELMTARGTAHWAKVVAMGLGGVPATFPLPT